MLFFFLTRQDIFAQEKTKENYTFQWKPIKGSTAYLFELRDEDEKVFFTEKIQDIHIKIPLASGYYQYRITALNNKEDLIEQASNWIDIRSGPALTPEIKSLQPLELNANKKNTLNVFGRHFTRQMQLRLFPPQGSPIKLSFERKSFTHMTVPLPSLSILGAYKIELTHPEAASVNSEAFSLVLPYPIVKSIEPAFHVRGFMPMSLTVHGQDFSDQAQVLIQGAKEIVSATVNSRQENKLSISVYAPLAEGEYQIMVKNSPLQKGTNGLSFQVISPSPPNVDTKKVLDQAKKADAQQASSLAAQRNNETTKPTQTAQEKSHSDEIQDLAPEPSWLPSSRLLLIAPSWRFIFPLGQLSSYFPWSLQNAGLSCSVFLTPHIKSTEFQSLTFDGGIAFETRYQLLNNPHLNMSQFIGTVGLMGEMANNLLFLRMCIMGGLMHSSVEFIDQPSSNVLQFIAALELTTGVFLLDTWTFDTGLFVDYNVLGKQFLSIGLKFGSSISL